MQGQHEHGYSGLSAASIKQSMLDNLRYCFAKLPQNATPNNWYLALAFTVRNRMIQQWITTLHNYTEDITVVGYLSPEFLTGPQLSNILVNLGMYDEVSQAVKELGLDLSELSEQEKEPGLGNGGKGRIAACDMDSLATCEIPAIGYGVRYEFGTFKQEIRDGWQVEMNDKWLSSGNPWEIQRPEIAYTIKLGGHTESYYDSQDCFRVRWIPKFSVKGIAYDTPDPGFIKDDTFLDVARELTGLIDRGFMEICPKRKNIPLSCGPKRCFDNIPHCGFNEREMEMEF